MKKLLLLFATLMFAVAALGQQTTNASASTPNISKYVWVEHSQINPAKADTYNRVARQFRDAAASVSPDVRWIGATSITGDANQITYITFANSLGQIDETMKAFGEIQHQLTVKNASFATEAGESELGAHSVLAKFRDDLSCKPNAIEGPQVTRWRVTTYRLRPGYTDDFEDLVKQVAALHAKAGDNAHWVSYQILGGESGPAFVIVRPMKSLADLDEEESPATKEVFSPIVEHQLSSVVKESVESIHTEFLSAEPALSRPPQNYVAENPSFWNPPEETAVAANNAPHKGRKSAAQPAGQKKEK